MFFSWLKHRRRQNLLAELFPPTWLKILQQNVRHYPLLPSDKQAMMQAVVRILVAEKNWEGGSGFIVTEEMKVTVAGQAAVLVLGLDEPYYFDRVQSIILYPTAYLHPSKYQGLFLLPDRPIMGEAWPRSPIILSWHHVLQCGQNADRGRNVVLHEFAHHVDGLDGDMDGTPPLEKGQMKNWYRVTEAEYLGLVGNARRDEVSLLDHYGASDRAEFFAVATECFFEQPHALQQRHPELYGVLRDFYRQDPATWIPDANLNPPLPLGEGSGVRADRCSDRKRNRRCQTTESTVSNSGSADALFAEAYLLANDGRYDQAEQLASQVIRFNPTDDEAYALRALARVKQGDFRAALDDADQALHLRPDSLDALRSRAAACIGLHRYEPAKDALDEVLHCSENDAEAYYLRGLAWTGLDNLKRAVSDFSLSLALAPLSADAHYHRAVALQKLGRAEDAEADYQKALQLDPQVVRRPV
ncbi:MAG: zinc-dependent peptidase [Pirellulales bacterium]|nr:zinc-dependent peptidase [Pirellulales bacterium]